MTQAGLAPLTTEQALGVPGHRAAGRSRGGSGGPADRAALAGAGAALPALFSQLAAGPTPAEDRRRYGRGVSLVSRPRSRPSGGSANSPIW